MYLICAVGFTEKEFEDVKGIILDTNFYLFALTIFVSVFHVSLPTHSHSCT